MRLIYIYFIVFIFLNSNVKSAAASDEVEQIYKQPCDPTNSKSCKPPYLTCEETIVNDETQNICKRKGFLPMEGNYHYYLSIK